MTNKPTIKGFEQNFRKVFEFKLTAIKIGSGLLITVHTIDAYSYNLTSSSMLMVTLRFHKYLVFGSSQKNSQFCDLVSFAGSKSNITSVPSLHSK